MKTTFSRFFLTALTLLMVALLLVGASFRLLVENYMEESAVEGLRSDAQVISGLASVYISDDSLGTMEFLMNLDVASQVSGADAVICNSAGRIILCSDSPGAATTRGWWSMKPISAGYSRKAAPWTPPPSSISTKTAAMW